MKQLEAADKREGVDPGELLDGATERIRRASRLLGQASLEGLHRCEPLLSAAAQSLNRFHEQAERLTANERRALQGRAEELGESLAAFLALVSQLRAYFEALASEMGSGQVAYDPSSSLVSLAGAVEQRPFAEL
jgi:hypothetical protein